LSDSERRWLLGNYLTGVRIVSVACRQLEIRICGQGSSYLKDSTLGDCSMRLQSCAGYVRMHVDNLEEAVLWDVKAVLSVIHEWYCEVDVLRDLYFPIGRGMSVGFFTDECLGKIRQEGR
jgi:hypothetical protein